MAVQSDNDTDASFDVSGAEHGLDDLDMDEIMELDEEDLKEVVRPVFLAAFSHSSLPRLP